MIRIPETAYDKLHKMVDANTITKDQYITISKAKNKKEFMSIIVSIFGFNSTMTTKIWSHILNSVWMDISDVFEPNEIFFVKILINNNGIILKSQIDEDIFTTNYYLNQAIKSLYDKEIIEFLDLMTWDKAYFFDRRFIKNAQN